MRITIALVLGILAYSSPADAQEKIRNDIHGDPLPEGALARLGNIKMRPGDVIRHLAFSPDGKQIACWAGGLFSTANALAVYDVASGNEVRWTPAFDGRCHALAWLRDGRGLALVQPNPEEDQVFLWEFTSPASSLPKREGPLRTHFRSTSPFALSPDGKWVASPKPHPRGKGTSIELRPWHSGKMFHELEQGRTLEIVGPFPGSILFAPDGESVVLIGATFGKNRLIPEATLVRLKDGSREDSIPLPQDVHVHSTLGFAVSPNADPCLAFQEINSARIVRLSKPKEETTIAFSGKAQRFYSPRPMAFSPDGKHMAFAEELGTIRFWNCETKQDIWKGDGEGPSALAFSHDGRLLAGGDYTGQIRFWETASGKEISPASDIQRMDKLAVSSDGKRAVTFARDTALCSWDLSTGAFLRKSEELGDTAWDLAFLPDRGTVVFGHKQQLKQWDLDAQVEPIPWPIENAFKRFTLSADGKTLATFRPVELSLWDWEKKTLRKEFSVRDQTNKTRQTRRVAVSHDGRHVAAFGYSNPGLKFLSVWDCESGKRVKDLEEGDVSCIRFAPSGPMLAVGVAPHSGDSGYGEKGLMLLNCLTGHETRFYKAPPNLYDSQSRRVAAVAFSPDGRLLASAENNHSVVLFEVSTGLPRRMLLGHRNNVSHLEFTSDSRRLVTISEDSTGLVWDLSLPTARKAGASVEIVKSCWGDLRNTQDGSQVHAALATLAANPAAFLDLCDQHLQPATELDRAAIKNWIADLDSNEFAVRSKADKELERLGEDVIPLLRDSLKKDLPLEQSRRLDKLIDRLESPYRPPHGLQELRAVEVLEYLATPEARKLLERLGGGGPQARLTIDARASLDRLAKQKKR
ncbi:MAG: WD40 repeat domain-containing protein [Planctomycetes bacterium]|nr:WD40 repeat domain-containing protein [Planctomycetota bacterium]